MQGYDDDNHKGFLELKNSKGKWETLWFQYEAATNTLSQWGTQGAGKANREPQSRWELEQAKDLPAGAGLWGRKNRFDVISKDGGAVVELNATAGSRKERARLEPRSKLGRSLARREPCWRPRTRRLAASRRQ